jgi:hypothetical protein
LAAPLRTNSRNDVLLTMMRTADMAEGIEVLT